MKPAHEREEEFRDKAAVAAMSSIIINMGKADSGAPVDDLTIATISYQVADAMVAVRRAANEEADKARRESRKGLPAAGRLCDECSVVVSVDEMRSCSRLNCPSKPAKPNNILRYCSACDRDVSPAYIMACDRNDCTIQIEAQK